MGYNTRNNNIRTFWPDNTDKEIYISTEINLKDMIEIIQEKWPNVTLQEISIESEYIHTDCLGYDQYDPTDYTSFIKIVKID